MSAWRKRYSGCRRRHKRGEQLAVRVSERAEVDLAQEVRELAAGVLAQRPRCMVAFGAEREHEQHGSLFSEREKLLEQQHRGRIGPVEILEREDEWCVFRHPRKELADDLERAPLQRLGRELRRARLRLVLERDLEQATEVRIKLI